MNLHLETAAPETPAGFLKGDRSTRTFDRFTDAEAMREIFQARLPGFPGGNLVATRCDILFTRYKTFVRPESRHNSSIALCYELVVGDRAGHLLGSQLFYAKAFVDGRSAQDYSAAPGYRLVAPRFGDPLMHWADLDMVLWAFPNDPALPHLAGVMNAKGVRPFLPDGSLAPGNAGVYDRADVAVEVIHYYPEERCTARYSLGSRHAAPQARSLIGKTYHDDKGREVYRCMQQLWELAQRLGDFTVAEPLGYNEAIKTVWQKNMVGLPVRQVMTAANGAEWLARIAKGLASLHRDVPANVACVECSDPAGDLPSKVEKLGDAFPDFHTALRALQQRLERRAPERHALRQTFIHGDFHLRQLLADEDRVVFLDFDECASGDPLQDLASFLVDLHFYDFEPAQVTTLGAAFLQAYMDASCLEVRRADLAWHIRLQWFTKAYRAYRQHLPDRQARVRELLALAWRDGRLAELLPVRSRRSARL